jgi:hypothetical protein
MLAVLTLIVLVSFMLLSTQIKSENDRNRNVVADLRAVTVIALEPFKSQNLCSIESLLNKNIPVRVVTNQSSAKNFKILQKTSIIDVDVEQLVLNTPLQYLDINKTKSNPEKLYAVVLLGTMYHTGGVIASSDLLFINTDILGSSKSKLQNTNQNLVSAKFIQIEPYDPFTLKAMHALIKHRDSIEILLEKVLMENCDVGYIELMKKEKLMELTDELRSALKSEEMMPKLFHYGMSEAYAIELPEGLGYSTSSYYNKLRKEYCPSLLLNNF